jgi:glycosyltransferase involved in cell wall biosynthesis
VGRDRGRDWQTLFEAVAESDWAVEVIARPHFLAGLDIPTEVTVLPPVDRDRYLQRVNDAAAVLIITQDVAYPTGQTVMLEAMALGKPIIATQTAALGEYFDDGVDAVGTALADPDDLRSHISNLLDEPGRRARIGQAGGERVRERGDAQSMWSAIAGLLDQTLAASRTDR